MKDDQEKTLEGLHRLSLEDLPRYKTAFSETQRLAWQHYFPFLYFFSLSSKSEYLLVSEERGSLCVYRRNVGKKGAQLLLASLPMPMNETVLQGCLERIREHNQSNVAAINWVDEEDIPALQTLNLGSLDTSAYAPDYMYSPDAYQSASWNLARNLRKNLSRFRSQYAYEVRPYTQADQEDCIALLDEWSELQKEKLGKILYQRYTIDCLKFADRFEQRDLFGRVILIDGKIRSFGFGGEMRPGICNGMLAYSDHRYKGLNYFLNTEMLMAMDGCVLVNGGRADTPGIKYAKESMCPVGTHVMYRVNVEPAAKIHLSPKSSTHAKPQGAIKLNEQASANAALIRSKVAEGANSYAGSPFLNIRRNLAVEVIAATARARGLDVVFHKQLLFELKGHGKSVMFSQNAPENSITAVVISSNKFLTKEVLLNKQLPTPQGRKFRNYDDAERYFMGRDGPQVVKPNSGSHGSGITTNVSSPDEFRKAWDAARTSNEPVIVEDFIRGDDLRVLVVGGRARAAYVRDPAHVIGNGVDNIVKLVEEKNRLRLENPRLKVSLIERLDLLEANGLDAQYVPATGERVQLTSVCNISAGGESIEIFDSIHPTILDIAEKSAQAIPGLNIAGVDLMVGDFTQPASADNPAMVLEINSNPSIVDPVFPMYGKPVDLPGMLIDYVFEDDSIGRKSGHPASMETTRHCPIYPQRCSHRAFPVNYGIQAALLKQAACRMNLHVTEISPTVYLLSGDGSEVTFNLGMPDRTTHVSRRVCNKRDWARHFLQAAGIRTASGADFSDNDFERAWMYAMKLQKPVVVKPSTGAGGYGVSTNLTTEEQFRKAWELARRGGAHTLLVEEYLPHNDYRLLVSGNVLVAACQRQPACIQGDGKRTVRQLIDELNRLRQDNPFLAPKLLKVDETLNTILARQDVTLDSVPTAGRELRLQDVASIGAGGSCVDVSDHVHPAFIDIAVRAKDAIFNPFHAAVDILAEDISRAPGEQEWAVIRVDVNPDLGMYHFPSSGTPRDVAGVLVSRLFPELPAAADIPAKSMHLLFRGKVQHVGLRNWIWRKANLHALSGWARNNPDGSLECVLRGAPNTVDYLIKRFAQGTTAAVIESFESTPCDETVEPGFMVDETTDLQGANPEYFRNQQRLEPALEKITPSTDVNIYIKAAGKLGLEFEVLAPGTSFCRITDGRNNLLLHSNATSLTSTVHRKLSSDKFLSLQRMRKAGVPCPVARSFDIRKEQDILDYVAAHRPVVLKPKSESLARGVTIDPQNDAAVLAALKAIRELKHRTVQVENYVEGHDYRVLVYGGELIGCIRWIPPFVMGDGRRTVRELVEAKNAYRSGYRLSAIVIEAAVVERQGYGVDDVLPQGRLCKVNPRALHSIGGEALRIDHTAIHPDNLEACFRAAEAKLLDFCGIDMISRDIGVSYRENAAVINEVNSCPMIDGHYFADVGEDTREAEAVLRKYFGLQG